MERSSDKPFLDYSMTHSYRSERPLKLGLLKVFPFKLGLIHPIYQSLIIRPNISSNSTADISEPSNHAYTLEVQFDDMLTG